MRGYRGGKLHRIFDGSGEVSDWNLAVFRLAAAPSGDADLLAGLVGPMVEPGSSHKQ
jgi:hypothetical protein